MKASSFFILQLNLEDTDTTDRDSAKLLLYVNGVLDAIMTFQDEHETTLFVHENDNLRLEFQRNNRSYGESQIDLKGVYSNGAEVRKWIKFHPAKENPQHKSPMVMLRMQAFRIGTDHIDEYQVKHILKSGNQEPQPQRQQSRSPNHCEFCRGKPRTQSQSKKLMDINDLMGQISTELRRMKQLLKSDLDERHQKRVRKMLLETQQFSEVILSHRKHWCKHCVFAHISDQFVRFEETQRVVASLSHHLDDSKFYQVLNKAHQIPLDSMNDRGSPIEYSKRQTSQKKSSGKKPSPDRKTLSMVQSQMLGTSDIVLARLVERLELTTGGSYPELNQTETLEVLVEDLIRQNETLKIENQMLNVMLNEERRNRVRELTTQAMLHESINDGQSYALSFSNSKSKMSFKDNPSQTSLEERKHLELKELFEQRERVINELMEKWNGDGN